MIDIEEYQRLQEQVTRAQREADRARGAMDAAMQKLKDEFGCETVAAAEALHKKLTKQANATEAKYEEALAAFKKEWGNVLDGVG